MKESLSYVLGSLGALCALFGAYVLLRSRHPETGPDPWLAPPATRACRWLLLLGTAVFALAFLVP